jgi:hypothetical protein
MNFNRLGNKNYFLAPCAEFSIYMVHCCRTLGMPNSQQGSLDLTSSSYRDNCDRLLYLEEKQREMCALSQNILTVSRSSTSLLCILPHSPHCSLPQMSICYSTRLSTRFLSCFLATLLASPPPYSLPQPCRSSNVFFLFGL